jgi:membrane-associated protease RseP (regulator of RpoE activity)
LSTDPTSADHFPRDRDPLSPGPERWNAPPRRARSRPIVHLVLLLLTALTTTFVGASHYASFIADFRGDVLPPISWSFIANGIWYSGTILAILGSHELGHYFACRYYSIDASLPYFLPAPVLLTGTLGAFIRIRQPIPTKAQLFDIGVAGPIAGFIVAVPALFLGVSLSRIVPLPPDFTGYSLGEPLLFRLASWMIWGTPPEGQSLNMHPMGFAAWFGLLATALNLFPIGQLDGGHIAYAALGRRSSVLTLVTVCAAIALTFFSLSWLVWTVLMVTMLLAFGWRHPRTIDEHVPLDPTRVKIAIFALVMLVLCFTPAPIEPLDVIKPTP